MSFMILLPQSSWEIQTTKQKGKGLFATKDIVPGTVIGDYIGKVLRTAVDDTSEKNGLYLLYYHDYASIYPEDLAAPGIHLINHSCAPNCWIYTYKGHTLFFSLRKIFAGEELTASYQLSPAAFCDPCHHACYCGSKHCRGTMHLSEERFQRWNAFSENQAKQTKRARIRYGKLLPQLPSYPTAIKDDPMYDLFGSQEKTPVVLSNAKLPSVPILRKKIRNTGRTLTFPRIKQTVVGIQDDVIVTLL